MCLFIENKNDFKIATKPILCYKKGYRSLYLVGELKAYNHPFFYSKDVITPFQEMEVIFSNYQKPRIQKGYHSIISPFAVYSKEVFIIPKGAKYYIGGINDSSKKDGYASDRIIWIGRKYSLITWFKVCFYKIKSWFL